MAVPKIQAPELIGRVRSAERNVRYIPTNQGRDLMEAGRAISNISLKGLDMAAGWADEKHRANYVKAFAEAENEAAERYMKEVENSPGFSAEGAAERARQIYAEVGAKYRPQIGGRYQEQFDVAWTRRSGSEYRRAFAFEQRNLKSASIGTSQAIIGKAVDAVAASMDPEVQQGYFDEIRENYHRLYQIENGGKRAPGEVLAEFDADVEKGTLKTRSGKTLRITEKDEGEGTISREKVKALRTRWEGQDKKYKAGLEKLYDQAHANVIDRLLKDDRVAEAEEYLLRIGDDNPVSEKTMKLLTKAVEAKATILADRSEAEGAVMSIVAEAENPRYNSADQDAAFLKRANGLSDNAKRLALQKWRELSQERAVNLQSDIYEFSIKELQTTDQNGKPVALPLSKQEEKIKAVTDPTLKEALLKSYRKRVIAAENELNADPVYAAQSDMNLLKFSTDFQNGFYVDEKGNRVPLNTKKDIETYVSSFGFTKKYRERVGKIISDSAAAVSPTEVRALFTKAGIEVPPNSYWEAFMLRELEDARGGQVFNSRSDRAKWMDELFTKMLAVEIGRRRKLGWVGEWFDYEELGTAMKEVPDGNAEWLFEKKDAASWKKIKANAGSPRAHRVFSDRLATAELLRARGASFDEGGRWVFLNPSKKQKNKAEAQSKQKPKSYWDSVADVAAETTNGIGEGGYAL